jgi:protein-disulfide isomerase
MSSQTSRKYAMERRAAKRRRTQLQLIIGVSIAAVLIAAIIIVVSLTSARSQAAGGADLDYQQFVQSVDRSGAVTLVVGDPNAPVTVTDYSDFSCGHCANLAVEMRRIIENYVSTGNVKFAFKPISFVNPPYSEPAAAAAICAAEQGHFLEMHDALWEIYATRGPNGYVPTVLIDTARTMGLDTPAFTACIQASATQADLEAVKQEAYSLGIQGTPTIFVNNQNVPYTGPDRIYNDLAAVIESALGS